jgi:hypothetical protein
VSSTAVDCVLSEWRFFDEYAEYLVWTRSLDQNPADVLRFNQYFGSCSEPCGGGVRQRFRFIVVWPQGRGRACDSLVQYVACNIPPCDSTRVTTQSTTRDSTRASTTESTSTRANISTAAPLVTNATSDTAMIWLVVILIVLFLASTLAALYTIGSALGLGPVGAAAGDVEVAAASFEPFTDLYATDSYASGQVRDNPNYAGGAAAAAASGRHARHLGQEYTHEVEEWSSSGSSASLGDSDENNFTEAVSMHSLNAQPASAAAYWMPPEEVSDQGTP